MVGRKSAETHGCLAAAMVCMRRCRLLLPAVSSS